MNLEPFLNAGLVIQIHIISALLALIVGAMLFLQRKGTASHKSNGKIWVCLMAIVALSSFFISDIKTFGPFSPIHLLSVVTLVSLVRIVSSARKKKIRSHETTVKALFFGGLVGAGIFTLLPGRIMHEIIFGEPTFYISTLGNAWIMTFSFAILVGLLFYWRSRKTS